MKGFSLRNLYFNSLPLIWQKKTHCSTGPKRKLCLNPKTFKNCARLKKLSNNCFLTHSFCVPHSLSNDSKFYHQHLNKLKNLKKTEFLAIFGNFKTNYQTNKMKHIKTHKNT